MTKTNWREEFEKNFSEITINKVIMSKDGWYESTLKDITDFIQQQINKAEERVRQELSNS